MGNRPATHCPALKGYDHLLDLVTQKKIRPSIDQQKFIHLLTCAAGKPDPDQLMVLLKLTKAPPSLLNAHDTTQGTTPLIESVKHGLALNTELLLQAKASPSIPDATGRFPLFYALEQQDSFMVRLLATHGADVNKVDMQGTVPFVMLFKSEGNFTYDLCAELVNLHADINALDASGQSVLAYALQQGDAPGVSFLLRHGACYTNVCKQIAVQWTQKEEKKDKGQKTVAWMHDILARYAA